MSTNRLIHATSPYLRQHAHNPVEWHAWGEEAIEKARKEDKPILLSSGYSSCYWCHVMEREVFENPSIAAQMNAQFVNIKLDREEHPDLDEQYMIARHMITGEGGWPNHVFLTPLLKPFYAGGTFGARESYGQPGFGQLLDWLHEQWTKHREEMEDQAERVTQALHAQLNQARQPQEPKPEEVAQFVTKVYGALSHFHDDRAGGFFTGTKFPHENLLLFLLKYFRATRSMRSADMLAHTLHAMAAGGLYDHVSGGFHRYAVDSDWLVPHFEKMLYNQALLASAYAEHYALTDDPYSADIASSVLDFVSGPMSAEEGGFYTAIDAESEGVEGAYYTWTPQEIREMVTEEKLAFFLDIYTLSHVPVHGGHKGPPGGAISAQIPLPAAATRRGMHYLTLAGHAADFFNTLLQARNMRVPPRLDDKILTGWNGLMIAAYARAGDVLDKPRYRERAEKAAQFILTRCRLADGELSHGYTAGGAQFSALLEDYAYLIHGLLALAEEEEGTRWVDAAAELMREAQKHLWDAQGGGAFAASKWDRHRILRAKTVEDGTLPSPNAIMIQNFAVLHRQTGEKHWRDEGIALASTFWPHVRDAASPTQTTTYAAALLQLFPDALTSMAADVTPQQAADLTQPLVSDVLTLTARRLDENGALEIVLDIAPGWHVNAPFAAGGGAVPLRIEVRGVADNGLEIHYPAAQQLHTLYADALPVYTGRVVIPARVLLAEEERDKPLEVHVFCQPCDERSCRLPVNVSYWLE